MTGEKKQQWIEFIQQYSLKKNEIDLERFKETKLGKALFATE